MNSTFKAWLIANNVTCFNIFLLIPITIALIGACSQLKSEDGFHFDAQKFVRNYYNMVYTPDGYKRASKVENMSNVALIEDETLSGPTEAASGEIISTKKVTREIMDLPRIDHSRIDSIALAGTGITSINIKNAMPSNESVTSNPIYDVNLSQSDNDVICNETIENDIENTPEGEAKVNIGYAIILYCFLLIVLFAHKPSFSGSLFTVIFYIILAAIIYLLKFWGFWPIVFVIISTIVGIFIGIQTNNSFDEVVSRRMRFRNSNAEIFDVQWKYVLDRANTFFCQTMLWFAILFFAICFVKSI